MELAPVRRVTKRNGNSEDFDMAKFASAVERAAREVGVEVSIEEVYDLALRELQPSIQESPDEPVHVEQVLDAIESGLVEAGYPVVAKAFIRYRNRRDRNRELGSAYSHRISDVGASFALRGSMEQWLWAVGEAAATRYITLAEIPPSMGRQVAEGYVALPSPLGYGRTVERATLSIAAVLASDYLKDRHVSAAKRLSVAVGHVVQAFSAASAEISGEQSYYGFDTDIGEIVRGFPTLPARDEYRHATQHLIYTMAHTAGRRKSDLLTVSLGLDTTEEGRAFTSSLLKSMAAAARDGVSVPSPHVVFMVSDAVNAGKASPNRDLLDLAVELASLSGGVSFAWGDDYSVAYFSDSLSVAAGSHVSLRISVNLPKIVDESGSGLEVAIDSVAASVARAVERHDAGLAGRTEGNFPALAAFSGESWGFERSLAGQPILIGLVGAGEAARVLDPQRAGLGDTARLAKVLVGRIRARLEAEDPRFGTYAESTPDVLRSLYARDRHRMASEYGIPSYLPSASVLSPGYPVPDRLDIEGELIGAFSVPTGVSCEGSEYDIMAAILAVSGTSAVVTVPKGAS